MKIFKCRSCEYEDLKLVLDLGDQPPSNSFIKPEEVAQNSEKRYPLAIVFCPKCYLLQLSYSVDPHELFSDYVYVSSTSRTLREHLAGLAQTLFHLVKPSAKDLVVDIGSNDGSLLRGYQNLHANVLGIEPSSVADIALANGIRTHKGFFSEKTAQEIKAKFGEAKIISATNVFAHIADQNDFIQGLNTLLADDGVFVMEASYVVDLVGKNLFDTIYHEHLYYYSVHSLDTLLQKRGLRVFDVERLEFGPSGPPLRAFICKQNAPFKTKESVTQFKKKELELGFHQSKVYLEFSKRVWKIREDLRALLTELKAKGEKILGYGASAKGNTILNTFGLDTSWIDCILEMNSLKVGLLTPGTHIPVVSETEFDTSAYKYALLLSWNLVNEFLEKADFIKKGGKFILPLPQPKIVP